MADADRDEKVSAGYRALGGEAPPRALDEAVLAAARRRPSRWRVPLSIAAVLVLGVGVTLRMLPQRPDAETVALAPQVMETPAPAAPAPSAPSAPSAPAPAADAARPAPATAAAGVAAQGRARAEIAAKPAQAELPPQAWLARIAALRKEGRTREADESLAGFKKRYPDYKIPENLR
jgi:hypothetical protein